MSEPAPARPTRLAVGLLAHDRPERVRAIIEALRHRDVTVCLHVDRSSAFAPDRFVPAVSPEASGRVVMVEPRSAVRWGSVRIVDATVATMRAARATDPEYFSLISGSCWPTRSPEEIVERLCGSGVAGYLDARPLDGGLWGRLDEFHLSGDLPGPVRRSATRVRVRLPRRDRGRVPEPYSGSAWFDLRGDVLAWLLDRIDADPGYRRAFAFTNIADEIYFHTLLMHSPFRDELVTIRDPDRFLFGLRYIRWEGAWHPELLTETDLEAAGRADTLFARKLP